jgi:hypothetical protein
MIGLIFALVANVSVRADELSWAHIDIPPALCDNWVSFPEASWVNNTGGDIRIKIIKGGFASSQSLVGEIAEWLYSKAKGGFPNGIIYSYGVESYASPQQSLGDTQNLGDDWITIAAGDTITLRGNCGPATLNWPNQPQQLSAPMMYVSSVVFYYTQAPASVTASAVK